MSDVRVVRLDETTEAQRERAAAVLVAAFTHMPSAWRGLAEAREEVGEFLRDPERRAWAALDGDALVGWVGAIPSHGAHAWELHPLAVDPARQRAGVGTRLVRALEAAARDAGVVTVWLGTDDDFGGTTAHGADLYADPGGHVARLAPLASSPAPHPVTFYRKLGYAVVGVLPDVNGPGRPDIFMARRVGA
jgi:aminoglycoside 6'-N-acetyltransferase I